MKSFIQNILLFTILVFFFGLFHHNANAADVSLFDVNERKKQLQTKEYSEIKKYCMALETKQPDDKMPEPIMGLKATKGYGTDKSLNDFTWAIMIHGGRSLSGEETSTSLLKETYLKWANANALNETEQTHDAYYALKRALLPIIVSYTIIHDDLNKDEQKIIENWITPLVQKIDFKFDGDVDHNNHRYLADSVLTLWGDIIDDKELYKKGKERFEITFDQMDKEGGLPLETRRGSRALWYMRQSLSNLTLIAEVYKNNGENLYDLRKDGKSFPLLTNYFVSAVNAPLMVLEESSANHIPGPSDYFLNQDMGMLTTRGGKRHYMAFVYPYIQAYGDEELSSIRLQALAEKTAFKQLPLIDDFMGGNTTCFWGKPK